MNSVPWFDWLTMTINLFTPSVACPEPVLEKSGGGAPSTIYQSQFSSIDHAAGFAVGALDGFGLDQFDLGGDAQIILHVLF